jgi:hypothetical protein
MKDFSERAEIVSENLQGITTHTPLNSACLSRTEKANLKQFVESLHVADLDKTIDFFVRTQPSLAAFLFPARNAQLMSLLGGTGPTWSKLDWVNIIFE